MKTIEVSIGGLNYTFSTTSSNLPLVDISGISQSFSQTSPIATSGTFTFTIPRWADNKDLWTNFFSRVTEKASASMAYLNTTLHKYDMSFVLNSPLPLYVTPLNIVHCGTEAIELASTYGTIPANTVIQIAQRGVLGTRSQTHYVSDSTLTMAAMTSYPTYWKGRDVVVRLNGGNWYRGILTDAPVLRDKFIDFTAVLIDNVLSGEFDTGYEIKKTTLAPVIYSKDRFVGYFSACSTRNVINCYIADGTALEGAYNTNVTFTVETSGTSTNRDVARNISDTIPYYSTTSGKLLGTLDFPTEYLGQNWQDASICSVQNATWNSVKHSFDIGIQMSALVQGTCRSGPAKLTIEPTVGYCCTQLPTNLATDSTSTLAKKLYDHLCYDTYKYNTGSSGINTYKQIHDAPVAHLARPDTFYSPWNYNACTPYTRRIDKFVGFYNSYNRKTTKDDIRGDDEKEKNYQKRINIKQHVLDYGDGRNFAGFAYGALFGYNLTYGSLFGEDYNGGYSLNYPIRPIQELEVQRDFEDKQYTYGKQTVTFYGLRVPRTWMEDEGDTSVQMRKISCDIAETFWEKGMPYLYLTDDYATYDPNSLALLSYGFQNFDIEWEEPNEGKLNGVIQLKRDTTQDINVDGTTYYAYEVKNAVQTIKLITDEQGRTYSEGAIRQGIDYASTALLGFGSWEGKEACSITVSPFNVFDNFATFILAAICSCEGSRFTPYDMLPSGYNIADYVDPYSFQFIQTPLTNFALQYDTDLSLSEQITSGLYCSFAGIAGYHGSGGYALRATPFFVMQENSFTTFKEDKLLSIPEVTIDNEIYTQYNVTYKGANFAHYDRNAISSFGAGSTLDINFSRCYDGKPLTDMTQEEANSYNLVFKDVCARLASTLGYPRKTLTFQVPFDDAAWLSLGDRIRVTTSRLNYSYLNGTANYDGVLLSISHDPKSGVSTLSIDTSITAHQWGWHPSILLRLKPQFALTYWTGSGGSLANFFTNVTSGAFIDQQVLECNTPGLLVENIGENKFAFDYMIGTIDGVLSIDGYPTYGLVTLEILSGNRMRVVNVNTIFNTNFLPTSALNADDICVLRFVPTTGLKPYFKTSNDTIQV